MFHVLLLLYKTNVFIKDIKPDGEEKAQLLLVTVFMAALGRSRTFVGVPCFSPSKSLQEAKPTVAKTV